jgi:hypothetical protein
MYIPLIVFFVLVALGIGAFTFISSRSNRVDVDKWKKLKSDK